MTTEGMGVDALKEQIKLKGLDTTGGGGKQTPLDEFEGDLASWDAYVQQARQTGQRNRTMVKLQFTDIDVVRTQTPYTAPNCEIEIPYSNQGIRADGQGSMWGWFAKSCEPFLGEEEGVDALVGKRIRLSYQDTIQIGDGAPTPVKLYDGRANDGAGGAVQRPAWIVVAVDGQSVGGGASSGGSQADSEEQILTAVDGRSRQEATRELLKIESVRNSHMSDIVDGTFFDKLVEEGKVTEQDGVLSKVS